MACACSSEVLIIVFQAEVVRVVKQERETPTKKHKGRLSNFEDVVENSGEGGCNR